MERDAASGTEQAYNNIRGNSYRMLRHAELSKAIHTLGN